MLPSMPDFVAADRIVLSDKLLSRVVAGANDCWIFTGARTRADGYGRVTHRGGKYLATRLSYWLHKGAIPDDHIILHSCDNPPCVNPEHLSAGTYSQNAAEAVERGRTHYPNAQKTHCPRGHEYDEANTYRDGKGRRCRRCHADRVARCPAKDPMHNWSVPMVPRFR